MNRIAKDHLPFNRRNLLRSVGGGFGMLSLAGLLQATESGRVQPHFAPKAKRVIFLFMNGGPFQCDLFDPKPDLNRFAGQKPAGTDLRTERPTGNLMGVPFKFARHGESGVEVSELLPHTAKCIDDICVLRSLYTDNPNHGPALFMMTSGSLTPSRPTLGAWLSYGLGTENDNLPGFVVLCPGRPVRFAELWSNGFLPGEHQGTYINHSQLDPKQMIPFLNNSKLSPEAQWKQLELMRELNAMHLQQNRAEPHLEARIRAMEVAYRMQLEASEAFDITREPASMRELYGKGDFANGCLLARRLAERGVRFTQVYYGNGQPWDTHSNHTASTRKLCQDIDQPIAALLTDLKQRGMLDDTLVVWGGEFGRTPTTENADGRDHNPWGFTMWMAGGGVRGGMTYGATDEFGFRSIEDKVHVHDLHATILHLMGFDHAKLTYRHAGRDYRLTDLYGRVVQEVIHG